MRSIVVGWVAALMVIAAAQPLRAAAAPAPPVEVRAFVNDSCIVADEPFYLPESQSASQARAVTLVAVVVGRIAEAMLDRVLKASAGRVSSTAARKDTRYAAAREMNLYRADLQPRPVLRLNAQLGCMTIVAGSFAPEGASCGDRYVPRTLDRDSLRLPEAQWQSSRTDVSLANPLRRANVCLLGEPQGVFESRFEFSPDGTAYRLTNAGYQVNSLLTTPARNATRNIFYTLEISQPGRTGTGEKLSIAMVDLGKVSAGARAAPPEVSNARWQRVPELTLEARRSYEEQTRVNLEVAAEVEALQRAITRHQRMVGSLETRAAGASGTLRTGLQQELLRNRVQVVALEGELAARRVEYQELPGKALLFMPVAIEIGVTETRSERVALAAMSQVVERNSGFIAGATTTLIGIPKGMDEVTGNQAAELEAARAAYYDAKVAARLEPQGPGEVLARSRERYDAARLALGLEVM